MINARFVCFHREKLGSSSPERRQLHCALSGSGPPVVAAHLKAWKFNCSLNSLGINIFVLQINILNCSVPSVFFPLIYNALDRALLHAFHFYVSYQLDNV